MNPSIESKVEELTIEQKLESIREINKQKDYVDRMISRINNLIEYKEVDGCHPDYRIAFYFKKPEDADEFRVPELIPQLYDMIYTHLKKRRADLIVHAQSLMSSSK